MAGFMFDLTDDAEPVATTQINDAVNQYNTKVNILLVLAIQFLFI